MKPVPGAKKVGDHCSRGRNIMKVLRELVIELRKSN